MESRDLFGGNMKMFLPPHHTDISLLREVPDNQEVFSHNNTDQCIIVEVLQYVEEPDNDAIRTHFEELASSNDASGSDMSKIISVELINSNQLSLKECGSAYCVLGEQYVAKFNESAKNALNIWMGVFRLPEKQTDILVCFNDPQHISPQSSSHAAQQHFDNSQHWSIEQFKQCLTSLTLVNPDFLL